MEKKKKISNLIDTCVLSDEKLDEQMRDIKFQLLEDINQREYSPAEITKLTSLDYTCIYRLKDPKAGISLKTFIKLVNLLGTSADRYIVTSDNQLETPGMRFEKLTRGVSPDDLEMIFSVITAIVKTKIKEGYFLFED